MRRERVESMAAAAAVRGDPCRVWRRGIRREQAAGAAHRSAFVSHRREDPPTGVLARSSLPRDPDRLGNGQSARGEPDLRPLDLLVGVQRLGRDLHAASRRSPSAQRSRRWRRAQGLLDAHRRGGRGPRRLRTRRLSAGARDLQWHASDHRHEPVHARWPRRDTGGHRRAQVTSAERERPLAAGAPETAELPRAPTGRRSISTADARGPCSERQVLSDGPNS